MTRLQVILLGVIAQERMVRSLRGKFQNSLSRLPHFERGRPERDILLLDLDETAELLRYANSRLNDLLALAAGEVMQQPESPLESSGPPARSSQKLPRLPIM